MKWPSYLMLIRHDVSEYNILKEKKAVHPLYRLFLNFYDKNPHGLITRLLAKQVAKVFVLNCSDAETPLVEEESSRAQIVGQRLKEHFAAPDVIFVSPYLRALMTLEGLKNGWPALEEVKVYKDDRVREQEHGLALLYNDWRIFFVLHPEQKRLHDQEGPYWYRYPQGESMTDVRLRNLLLLNTLTRDFAGKKVLIVTHHLNILGIRANLGRFSPEQFIEIDEKDKPINCGVTLYRGYPDEGTDGRLKLEFYNEKYF